MPSMERGRGFHQREAENSILKMVSTDTNDSNDNDFKKHLFLWR